jgi:hypothetical protein
MKTNDQRWRKLPHTSKQEEIMDQLHIPYDENMTRGEASDAIAEELENSPHPFSEEAFNP